MHGPKCGYYPEADKSILIVAEGNVEEATECFATEGFKIRTGARHLGSCIGAIDDRDEWIRSKISDWVMAVKPLAMVAKKIPQTA